MNGTLRPPHDACPKSRGQECGVAEHDAPAGAADWLGLAPVEGAGDRWQLTVQPRLCGRTGFLHGGCSLAAAATAMELATGRPLLWASAQYVARAAIDEDVTYAVTVASAGNRMSQVGVTVSVGERLVATAMGAVGRRSTPTEHRWGRAPVVPGPQDCAPYALGVEPEGSFHRNAEILVAHADPAAGTVALWARLPGDVQGSAAGLAMLGDYVPAGFRLVLAETEKPASSLDNAVRVVGAEPVPWVLLDIRLGAVADGAAHGDLRAWSPEGRLLALASQGFLFNI